MHFGLFFLRSTVPNLKSNCKKTRKMGLFCFVLFCYIFSIIILIYFAVQISNFGDVLVFNILEINPGATFTNYGSLRGGNLRVAGDLNLYAVPSVTVNITGTAGVVSFSRITISGNVFFRFDNDSDSDARYFPHYPIFIFKIEVTTYR
jgi:hypothetical protein